MRKLLVFLCALMIATFLTACGSEADKNVKDGSEVTGNINENQEKVPDPTSTPTLTPSPTARPTSTPKPTPTPVVPSADAVIATSIPGKYNTARKDEYVGKIEAITYSSYNYCSNPEEVTSKNAYVYLPYGYSEDKQYNVLYLMHGIGGNENEWGMKNDSSRVKIIMDNLIFNGDIEPFIVVTPNGKSGTPSAGQQSYDAFYCFGQELRNDLIPYIESHYSTYGAYNEAGYDLTEARAHRAMAGLSMGGMQTINIGLCECLDILSYFGAFSAAPTSYEDTKIASIVADKTEYDIKYFYNVCGKTDSTAYWSASAAAKNLPSVSDRFIDGENFMWMERSGGHDFSIWYLGFYNFAQLVFTK